MDLHAAVGEVYASWARGRLTDPEWGSRSLRNAMGTERRPGQQALRSGISGLRVKLEAETRSGTSP